MQVWRGRRRCACRGGNGGHGGSRATQEPVRRVVRLPVQGLQAAARGFPAQAGAGQQARDRVVPYPVGVWGRRQRVVRARAGQDVSPRLPWELAWAAYGQSKQSTSTVRRRPRRSSPARRAQRPSRARRARGSRSHGVVLAKPAACGPRRRRAAHERCPRRATRPSSAGTGRGTAARRLGGRRGRPRRCPRLLAPGGGAPCWYGWVGPAWVRDSDCETLSDARRS